MTKEEFLQGKKFQFGRMDYYAYHAIEGRNLGCVVKFEFGEKEGRYLANLKDVTDLGFSFFGSLLNAQAEGFVSFAYCKLVEPC